MRPYIVQNLKSDLGETSSARVVDPFHGMARSEEKPGTEVTIQPETGVVYECGEAAALTLSDCPEKGSFAVVFTSGAEPTVLTVPNTLHMPEDYAVEADTRYEIHVRDGYALCAGWAVSAS